MSFRVVDMSETEQTTGPVITCGTDYICFNIVAGRSLNFCEKVFVLADREAKQVAFKKAKATDKEYRFAMSFYKQNKEDPKIRVIRWVSKKKVAAIRAIFGLKESSAVVKFAGEFDKKENMLIFKIKDGVNQ